MITDHERAYLRALGLRLRLLRIASRLSQAQLGEAVDVTRAQVSAIERADHAANLLVYARLATALGLRLPDLIGPDIAASESPRTARQALLLIHPGRGRALTRSAASLSKGQNWIPLSRSSPSTPIM